MYLDNIHNNQKGSSLLIILILSIGLIAGYYLVNFTKTNLKPKAYEGDPTNSTTVNSRESQDTVNAGGGCGFTYACEQNQAVIYSSLTNLKDENGRSIYNTSCVHGDRQPINKSCTEYFCDDKIYPESDGRLIHKYATSFDRVDLGWQDWSCTYTYVPVPQVTIINPNPDKSINLIDQCRPEVYCDKSNIFYHKYVKREDPFNPDGSCKFQFENTNVSCVYEEDSYYYTKTDIDRAQLMVKYGIIQVPQDFQVRSGAESFTSALCKPGQKSVEYGNTGAWQESDASYYCAVCNSTGKIRDYGELIKGSVDKASCK